MADHNVKIIQYAVASKQDGITDGLLSHLKYQKMDNKICKTTVFKKYQATKNGEPRDGNQTR